MQFAFDPTDFAVIFQKGGGRARPLDLGRRKDAGERWLAEIPIMLAIGPDDGVSEVKLSPCSVVKQP